LTVTGAGGASAGRRGAADVADVVVVGTALAGLVAGAILTRQGRRVVLLDQADVVGGRGGATRTASGYWIGFGHRDGHDVGDCQFPWHFGAEAAREADVTVKLRRVDAPLRLHRLVDGSVLDGGAWGAEGMLGGAVDWFGCPPAEVGALKRLVRRLATAPDAEREAAIPVLLGDWLEREVPSAGIRRALLRMATVIFHPAPEEASLGRLMQFFAAPGNGAFVAADDQAGGMQGLMEPWARAIAARGGEIALGWKPVEIVVERGRATGVVAVDRSNLVREVRAPVVIAAYPAWETLELVDASLLDADIVRIARALRGHRADVLGWQAGLTRLPRIRATGAVESHDGWNRFLRGAEQSYGGGYQITSLLSPSVAPPGHHLLELAIARFYRGRDSAGQPWAAARTQVDEAIAYLHRFYADLDECLAWSSYQLVAAPQSMSWVWAPVKRHGLDSGLPGLLLAGSTIESPARIVDIGAWAGMAAARRAAELLRSA
jgi:phytoene dehydrogenase-like protein